MTSDEIDSILIRWHSYGNQDTGVQGYPRECPSTRGYRSSQQWRGTDVDEEGDVYLSAPDPFTQHIGRVVDEAIKTMEAMHQLALAYQARALAVGSYAIRNPRLPQGDELVYLIADARGRLVEIIELRAAA